MIEDEGFERLRVLFAEDMAEKVRSLRSLMREANWPEIGKIAHQIGGTARSFGYPEISDVANELERSTGRISLEEATLLVDKISEKFVL